MRKIVTAVIALAWLVPATVRAEVVRFDVLEHVPAFAGRVFGDVGPYERITARATMEQIAASLPAANDAGASRPPAHRAR